jgi:iron complex transport system ATP-binding protein
MTQLMADEVTLTRGSNQVLAGVSVEVASGELVCIAGPNGAGKSTLLAALAGDLDPDRGAVTIDGKSVGSIRAPELATLRAVLPQQHRVAFGFSAAQVIDMGWAPHGALDDEVMTSTINRLDLEPILHRPFRVLSGGEQARVALARILVQNTPIQLLDEPTAALDLRHQELVMTIAREQADAGRAVVVVVHDLNLAAAYSDRVTLLAEGRVLADGAPATVFEPPVLEAAYRIAVTVTEHPTRQCPLVLTAPATESAPML